MSLSHHLVDTYERKPVIPPHPPSRPSYSPNPSLATPFGDRTRDSDSSWMSGHGGFAGNSTTMNGFSRWSEEKIATLQVRLARKLGPEYVTQRPGPGGGPKLSYIEGWKVINLANEVFGFNGWSSSIASLTTDYIDVNDQGRCFCNVTAIVRITLADGSWHEDVGCGQSENIKSKGAALDKAKKEAVTDATKRAFRTFGNVLGNCLYDKDYTREVVKIKVPPAKFQREDLERRAEFTEAGAPGPSRASALPPHMNPTTRPAPPIATSNGNDLERPSTPLRSIDDTMGSDDVFMEESFDAEFLDESFMRDVPTGENMSSTLKQDLTHVVTPPHQLPAAPAYQHRHRPDPQPVVNTAAASIIAGAKPYDPEGAARRQAAMKAAMMAAGEPSLDHSIEDPVAGGSSGETLPDARKPMGGIANPQANRPGAGSAARAQAISAANQNNAPRSSSPRIPSGGIDAVAARATYQYEARAVALGLEEEIAVESKAGFQSARGIKRAISGGQVSPTKAGQGHDRDRKPLGEISHGQVQEDWQAKRARG